MLVSVTSRDRERERILVSVTSRDREREGMLVSVTSQDRQRDTEREVERERGGYENFSQ